MNQFQKKVQLRCELYNEYTKLLNSLLGLTDKQVLVLSKLFELWETVPTNRYFLDRESRKDIMESCSINECNLSTYLTLFKGKSILTKSLGKGWILNQSIRPRIWDNEVQVIFKIGLDV